jgi:hypothetical protein
MPLSLPLKWRLKTPTQGVTLEYNIRTSRPANAAENISKEHRLNLCQSASSHFRDSKTLLVNLVDLSEREGRTMLNLAVPVRLKAVRAAVYNFDETLCPNQVNVKHLFQ